MSTPVGFDGLMRLLSALRLCGGSSLWDVAVGRASSSRGPPLELRVVRVIIAVPRLTSGAQIILQ